MTPKIHIATGPVVLVTPLRPLHPHSRHGDFYLFIFSIFTQYKARGPLEVDVFANWQITGEK